MEFYNMKVFVLIAAISFILWITNTGNVFSQSFQKYEQSEIHLKLLNLTKDTGNDIVESMRAIESSDDNTALNILSNVTVNIEEIYNGLDVLIDVTTKDNDWSTN
jgi:hypothetical protein